MYGFDTLTYNNFCDSLENKIFIVLFHNKNTYLRGINFIFCFELGISPRFSQHVKLWLNQSNYAIAGFPEKSEIKKIISQHLVSI